MAVDKENYNRSNGFSRRLPRRQCQVVNEETEKAIAPGKNIGKAGIRNLETGKNTNC